MINVRIANKGDIERIDDYIERVDSSSLYHNYRWGMVVEKTFGHNSYYLLGENSDRNIQGILPIIHMKSLLFGNFLIPFRHGLFKYFLVW